MIIWLVIRDWFAERAEARDREDAELDAWLEQLRNTA